MTGNRDGQGRFLPGHEIKSPGRPKREVETAYLETMYQGISLEDWSDITIRAVIAAKQNDWRARDWLSSHIVRKAAVTLAIEDDDPDGGRERLTYFIARAMAKVEEQEPEQLPSGTE